MGDACDARAHRGASRLSRQSAPSSPPPPVDVIGHPSGRVIDHRPPSDFDLSEILRIASEEGCALEVNSQTDRLDLSDAASMAAKRAGVKLVVSSDSHSPSGFGLLQHGVNQARRGWLEPADVLNTQPLAKLRQRQRLSRV
jgi:DNA polymerase (family 10)